uniref:Luciferase-like monooxygenase n=1 Tax=Caulobacter sp. (strain K31) TaxID=366602 RepID=B0T969_CAUSK
MTAISVLDFVRITRETNARQALDQARELAAHAEALGYRRYWVPEHHNFPGIVGAATSVVLSHIAAGTRTIRIGAGGVMMPNHPPLVVAEQFGTLAQLFPDRIDLGIGRAPGGDQNVIRALRRPAGGGDLMADAVELLAYFGEEGQAKGVRAMPAAATKVPLWILGSSLYGARLGAELGLPYAFASHFAPEALLPALQTYRDRFKPSVHLERPYAMMGVNIVAAETDAEAVRLATTQQMTYTDLIRGRPGVSQPPLDDINTYWSPVERDHVTRMLGCSIIGSLATVRAAIAALVAQTGVDELIIDSDLYDHGRRMTSLEIIAEAVAT